MIKEIALKQWQDFANKIESEYILSSRPWQNVVYCSQYVGIDFLLRSDRKYFGYFEPHIAASACVYKLNEKVARIRSPYCLPEYRNKGIMRSLFEHILLDVRRDCNRFIVFSISEAVPFYKKMGFHLIQNMEPFNLQNQMGNKNSNELLHLLVWNRS